MKALIKKYIPLVAMLFLLVLIISFLPTEASRETASGSKATSGHIQEAKFTSSEMHR